MLCTMLYNLTTPNRPAAISRDSNKTHLYKATKPLYRSASKGAKYSTSFPKSVCALQRRKTDLRYAFFYSVVKLVIR
jgi:hypothetical protein